MGSGTSLKQVIPIPTLISGFRIQGTLHRGMQGPFVYEWGTFLTMYGMDPPGPITVKVQDDGAATLPGVVLAEREKLT